LFIADSEALLKEEFRNKRNLKKTKILQFRKIGNIGENKVS